MKRVVLLLMLIVGLSSCDRYAVCHNYLPTPVEGWEPMDTLVFEVDTLRNAGSCMLSVGVRTSSAEPYPYQTLWLVVKQMWDMPQTVRVDTVACRITNDDGDIMGDGVVHYQYCFPFDTISLPEVAHGKIVVRHIMRHKMLRGITDVGIELKKE